MSILEASIFFKGETLLDKQFYAGIGPELIPNRVDLIKAIVNMAENAFMDEIKKFSVGPLDIYLRSDKIACIDNCEEIIPIYIYIIAESNTNSKAIEDGMQEALFQFVNRFSKIDIFGKDFPKFEPFAERFYKIFKGLIFEQDFNKYNENERKYRSSMGSKYQTSNGNNMHGHSNFVRF